MFGASSVFWKLPRRLVNELELSDGGGAGSLFLFWTVPRRLINELFEVGGGGRDGDGSGGGGNVV